jgi:transcriptional regulator with XRE-family HTH domain
MASIGSRIRRQRQILGMKQHELAAAVGVDRSAVSNWERGRHPPLRYQGKVEEVLGISLDDEPQFLPVPPELRHLIEQRLPDPADQRRVIGLLEGTVTWPAADDSRARQDQDASGSQAG